MILENYSNEYTKKKHVRANNAPFMTKNLRKPSWFVGNYGIDTIKINRKQRNRVKLLRSTKKITTNNLDTNLIMENKIFWKTHKVFRKIPTEPENNSG